MKTPQRNRRGSLESKADNEVVESDSSFGDTVPSTEQVLGYGKAGTADVYYENRVCTCGGENSSCFKCDGTGYYRVELILNKKGKSSQRNHSNSSEVSFVNDSRGGPHAIRENGRFASAPSEADFDA